MKFVLRWSQLSDFSRDVVIATSQFAFGLVLYATAIYPLGSDSTDTPVVVRTVIFASICACSLLRRRAPVWALALSMVPFAIDLALGPTVPVWLLVSDFVYAVALYGTARQSITIVRACAALTLAVCVLVFVLTQDVRDVVIALGAAAAFLGTSLWWARSVRLHRDSAQHERERAEAVTLIAELDRRAAVEAERSRMARDLHDVVAGHLSAIAIQSEAVVRVMGTGGSREDVLGILSSIRTNSTDALTEMRSMIGLLRSGDAPDEVKAPGRIHELDRLVSSARASGTDVRVVANLVSDGSIPAAIDQAAYRIVQEALTNAVVHAPGTPTCIEVRRAENLLTVVVTNPLPVPHARPATSDARRSGTGLDNMRGRAELSGGRFRAGPDGGQWVVEAVLPLPNPVTT